MNRLPLELHRQVFAFAIGDAQTCMRVTRVCRAWAHFIMTQPNHVNQTAVQRVLEWCRALHIPPPPRLFPTVLLRMVAFAPPGLHHAQRHAWVNFAHFLSRAAAAFPCVAMLQPDACALARDAPQAI